MSLASRAIGWMVDHRASMPRWVERAMESAARHPDGLIGRAASRLVGGSAPPPTTVPDTPLRVYIAPTNYSGQGYLWARALEDEDPRIGARDVAVVLPGGFDFPADTHVPIGIVNSSDDWAEREWAAASRFTHVLIEAERSLFGRRFGRSLADEVAALESAGVSVAFLAHGTDVRDPDRHAARTPWSPYPEDPRTDTLRGDARRNLTFLRAADRPTFVSTPDLLDDLPDALWCPVVVDAAAFAAARPPLRDGPLRVVHASSAPVQKGSHLIEPALAPLTSSGGVEYRAVTGAAAATMPAVFAAADVVVDQLRLGSYGVAACEAMAAGRVVVGHVLPDVRAHIRAATGLDLPIVEATPDTLLAVVTDLRDDPERARRLAAAGPPYVAAVHSGSRSARALIDGWITPTR